MKVYIKKRRAASQLIVYPIIILAIGALITVGTIGSSGTVGLAAVQATSSCNTLSSNLWNVFNPFVLYPCLLNIATYTIIGQIMFPATIQQYNQTVVTTATLYSGSTSQTVVATTYYTTSTCATLLDTNNNPYISCAPLNSNPSSPITSIQFGFLGIIILMLTIVVISGIQIAGSGLNTASIYIIFKTMGYVIIWFLLSSLSSALFFGTDQSIPSPFGGILYLVLSLFLVLGIFLTM